MGVIEAGVNLNSYLLAWTGKVRMMAVRPILASSQNNRPLRGNLLASSFSPSPSAAEENCQVWFGDRVSSRWNLGIWR
jgi:hypothetical protein